MGGCCQKSKADSASDPSDKRSSSDALIRQSTDDGNSDANHNNEPSNMNRSLDGERDSEDFPSADQRDSFASKYMQEMMEGRKSKVGKDRVEEVAHGLDQRTKGLEEIDDTAKELNRGAQKLFQITSKKKFRGD